MYVTIREDNSTKATGQGWSELKIGGNNIGFLKMPLLSSLRGTMKKKDANCTYWRLKFFSGSAFEVVLFVTLSEDQIEKSGAKAQAIWQGFANNQPSQETVLIASQWLRGSNTLGLDAYTERNNRFVAIDGSGFSMLSESLHKGMFERAVLLLALACAYQVRMKSLTNELACWDGKHGNITSLAVKASEFNAKYYFKHPVALKNIELPYFWDGLAERMRLHEQDTELNDQIRALHQIINEIQRNKDNTRWQRIGLVLGIISAVQVFGLIPESVRNGWVDKLIAFLN